MGFDIKNKRDINQSNSAKTQQMREQESKSREKKARSIDQDDTTEELVLNTEICYFGKYENQYI